MEFRFEHYRYEDYFRTDHDPPLTATAADGGLTLTCTLPQAANRLEPSL